MLNFLRMIAASHVFILTWAKPELSSTGYPKANVSNTPIAIVTERLILGEYCLIAKTLPAAVFGRFKPLTVRLTFKVCEPNFDVVINFYNYQFSGICD